MHPRVGDLAQPGSDSRVGRIAIDLESFGTELAGQRHVKARAQVADEALDLALGLGPIGPAQPRHEAVMMREVEEGAVIAMQPRPVAIPIGHHRAHVVVQHLARNPAEEVKGALMAAEQRLQPLIGDELDVGRPAPSQRRDEHREPVAPAPDGREVSLHLAPWFGLEPNQRLRLGHWSQRREVILQDAVAARIAERPQLAQQHRRRNPVRRGGLHSLIDVMLVGVELARSRFTLVPRQSFAPQIASHRVA